MIALDRSHAGNGALNVLRASHKLGRLDHSRVVDHEGEGARSEMHADPEVPAALPRPTRLRHPARCCNRVKSSDRVFVGPAGGASDAVVRAGGLRAHARRCTLLSLQYRKPPSHFLSAAPA